MEEQLTRRTGNKKEKEKEKENNNNNNNNNKSKEKNKKQNKKNKEKNKEKKGIRMKGERLAKGWCGGETNGIRKISLSLPQGRAGNEYR